MCLISSRSVLPIFLDSLSKVHGQFRMELFNSKECSNSKTKRHLAAPHFKTQGSSLHTIWCFYGVCLHRQGQTSPSCRHCLQTAHGSEEGRLSHETVSSGLVLSEPQRVNGDSQEQRAWHLCEPASFSLPMESSLGQVSISL